MFSYPLILIEGLASCANVALQAKELTPPHNLESGNSPTFGFYLETTAVVKQKP